MQTSLSLQSAPLARIPTLRAGVRRSASRGTRLRGLPVSAGAPANAGEGPASTSSTDRSADTPKGRSRGFVLVLQVIREGTGLAGVVLWSWACLRLLGGL